MTILTIKHTRQAWRELHPHKAKKKLVHGISKDKIEAQWLRTNGWMTKRPAKPPYKFLYRKEIIKIPKRVKSRLKTQMIRKRIQRKKSNMSIAAKKAWRTRRQHKKH